jgi:murein DD-endopeptidase MepM/ murein hydrolase activator NlpD
MPAFFRQRSWFSLALALILLWPGGAVLAQEGQPEGPVYIVQSGDTLWDISQRFGVDMTTLQQANDISDPGQLVAGVQLVIPGYEGIRGTLVTEIVPFGETLRSLSRKHQVPIELLARLNHVVSPVELYSGANLIVPDSTSEALPARRASLAGSQSLFELAVIHGTNTWRLEADNYLDGTWEALPGDVLRVIGEDGETTFDVPEGPGALPGEILSLSIEPLPLVQGSTAVIRLEAQNELEVSGSIMDYDLHFFDLGDGGYAAMQGVHALTVPGLYPMSVLGTLGDGTPFGFSQMIYVRAGDFTFETLEVDPQTVDPENTRPEDEIWNALTQPVTPERLWDGVFSSPVSRLSADCYPSYYGSRRSYNGSPFNYFHTGLDFCYSSIEPQIFAPAAGTVVFTGELTVRGNATMIDHGWGVFTGYMHQAEILVDLGDRVEAGDLIGIMGRTGRVTGAHLHLEVWVGGVQVEPLDWLERPFP